MQDDAEADLNVDQQMSHDNENPAEENEAPNGNDDNLEGIEPETSDNDSYEVEPNPENDGRSNIGADEHIEEPAELNLPNDSDDDVQEDPRDPSDDSHGDNVDEDVYGPNEAEQIRE